MNRDERQLYEQLSQMPTLSEEGQRRLAEARADSARFNSWLHGGHGADLLNEIVRLQGLINAAEWSGFSDDALGFECCPWCKELEIDAEHTSDCPAFGSAR